MRPAFPLVLLAIVTAAATSTELRAQTIELPNRDPILKSGDRAEDRWRKSAPKYLRTAEDPYPWLDWAARDPSARDFRSVLPTAVQKELERLRAQPDEYLQNAESTHFQIIIGRNGRVSDEWTEGRRKAYLNALEWYYHVASHRLGLIPSIESWRAADRKKGVRWKVNVVSSNSGVPGMLSSGTAVSFSDNKQGLHGIVVVGVDRSALPVGAAHEFGHGLRFDVDHTLWKQLDSKSGLVARTGFLSESFANWVARRLTGAPLIVGPPRSFQRHAQKDPDSKFQNYHQWFLWEHLTSEEGLGLERTWDLFRGSSLVDEPAPRDETTWERARRLYPEFDDEFAEAASRVATLDFRDGEVLRRKAKYGELDSHMVLPTYPIERLDEPGWFDVPPWKAPSAFGFNIVPLRRTRGAKEVRVEFAGRTDPALGSAWRLRLVAASEDLVDVRYSDVWSTGEGSLEVRSKDELLFLVVVAVPEVIDRRFQRIDDVPHGLARESAASKAMPYAVRITGAEVWDLAAESMGCAHGSSRGRVKLEPHENGGGLVADTATVSPRAFVGPDARVLGFSRVEDDARIEGQARIEDFAWIETGAIVRDSARVRDHAWVRREAVIEGEARVEEFGRVDRSAIASGRSRIREMGALNSKQRIDGAAIIEGLTEHGNWCSGNALLDGNLLGSKSEIEDGVHLSFREPGEEPEPTNGRILEYQFERDHPYLAWDTHGVNHAFCEGGAELGPDVDDRGSVLELDGRGSFLRLPHGTLDLIDMHVSMVVRPMDAEAMPLLTGLGRTSDGVASLRLNTRLELVLETPEGSVQVTAPRPLPVGTWSKVSIDFKGDRVALGVDGVTVAERETALNPEDVKATTVLLGRDERGRSFTGQIDDVRVYRCSMEDRSPPEPNPPLWDLLAPPRATGSNSITMRAAPVADYGASAGVEYEFRTISEGGESSRSGWIPSATYKAVGLRPTSLYACQFRARDLAGNVGEWSLSRPVVTLVHDPPCIVQPEEADSIGFVFEAEDTVRRVPGATGSAWEVVDEAPEWTDHVVTGVALRATAGEERTDRPFAAAELGGLLEYVIRFRRPGTYRLTLLGGGPDAKQNSVTGTLDYAPLRTLEHISVKEGRFQWFSRAMATKSFVTFDIPTAGSYVLQLRAREAGTLLDRVQIQPQEQKRRFPGKRHPAIPSTQGTGDAVAPPPLTDLQWTDRGRRVTWSPCAAGDVTGYVVFAENPDQSWSVLSDDLSARTTRWSPPKGVDASRLAVSAKDRAGNLGTPAVVER